MLLRPHSYAVEVHSCPIPMLGRRLRILWGKAQSMLPAPGKKGGMDLAPVPGLPDGKGEVGEGRGSSERGGAAVGEGRVAVREEWKRVWSWMVTLIPLSLSAIPAALPPFDPFNLHQQVEAPPPAPNPPRRAYQQPVATPPPPMQQQRPAYPPAMMPPPQSTMMPPPQYMVPPPPPPGESTGVDVGRRALV